MTRTNWPYCTNPAHSYGVNDYESQEENDDLMIHKDPMGEQLRQNSTVPIERNSRHFEPPVEPTFRSRDGHVGMFDTRRHQISLLREQLRKLQDQVAAMSQTLPTPNSGHHSSTSSSEWPNIPAPTNSVMAMDLNTVFDDMEPLPVGSADVYEGGPYTTQFESIVDVVPLHAPGRSDSVMDQSKETTVNFSNTHSNFDEELDQQHRSDSTSQSITSGSSSQPSDEYRFRNYQADQWSAMFDKLLAFKRENGHCRVPHTSKKWPVLGRWVKRQRYQQKLMLEGRAESTMTPARAAALEKVGLLWDSHNSIWHHRYSELKAFCMEHGHANVPSDYPTNPQLSTWVKFQRRSYKTRLADKKRGTKPSSCDEKNPARNITLERIQALEAIGFQWEIRRRRTE